MITKKKLTTQFRALSYILIADDDLDDQELLKDALEEAEFDTKKIRFVNDGKELVDSLGANSILPCMILLDLNMPKMDGYQVLEAILAQDLPTLTIVISGDIQPEAHQRVTSLGALGFIQKPINKDILTKVLSSYGIFSTEETNTFDELELPKSVPEAPVAVVVNTADKAIVTKVNTAPVDSEAQSSDPDITLSTDVRDCYQEIANVAMGRAGDLLARLLNVFVELPIPNVNFIEVSELRMALKDIENHESTSGICQGFISAGISGEALLILNDSSFKDVASLMNYQYDADMGTELELLMDLANVLIGACLKGISEQLDIQFSQGHPEVLGQHRKISDLIANNANKWKKTLAIEISYSIENYPIKCDLLLLFTEKSMQTLNNKLAYLIE